MMLPDIQLNQISAGNDSSTGTNDPFLEYLLCNKTTENLKRLRNRALKRVQGSVDQNNLPGSATRTTGTVTAATGSSATVTNSPLLPLQEYQIRYSELEFKTSRTKYDSLKRLKAQYRQYQQLEKKRHYSVNFDGSKPEDFNNSSFDNIGEYVGTQSITETGTTLAPASALATEAANLGTTVNVRSTGKDAGTDRASSTTPNSKVDDYELSELRRRLLGKYRYKQSTENAEDNHIDENESIDRQIEDHDNIQQDLIQDMTKLVNSLKQGAIAFQSALDEDNQVLGAAEIGIQVASRGIMDISGKLGRYDRKKLGYLFYIGAALFMFFGLIITFFIIKLFPAL